MINLMRGDCLERMKEIPDGSVDMVLCDLPYGTTGCKWDVVISFEALWAQYRRIVKSDGALVLFGQEPFSSALRMSSLDMYRYDIIWNKRKAANIMSANKMPLKVNELISVFYREHPTYNPQKSVNPKGPSTRHKYKVVMRKTDETADTFDRSGKSELKYSDGYEADKLNPTTIVEFSKDAKPVHPTQKPVALLEYLINTYTNAGDTVLDNTMGSGSTGVACVNTGRKFIGIEMDEKYFAIAEQRIYGALPVAEAL